MQQSFLEKPSKPPLWTKNFILICITTFMFWAASHMVMLVLPKYALSLGADARFIGLINGGISEYSRPLHRPVLLL
ncbi:hypothetical protein AN618_23090 [Fervidicola ferrireducens]|uniref:Major facilitator superfamily (MFS) profile domain-containing protein n=1 Tax=Fervidicola ferrireducens TaxID=520764 RepID=A0A140L1K0_9FIRM|nr:hypothetical protein [Fervidicola ferrireducens]KXG74425.1 hypothetical protein AN618_23090 [Fervidicola ferrireducens]